MYKLFKKELKKDLKTYLEDRGFRHYKDETFICFYNDLLFILSFDQGSYGTSLNMSLSIGVPVIQNNFLNEIDLETFTIKGSSLGSSKWELEIYNKYDLEGKKKKIDEYVEDIKYIYTNYISYYISKEINSFDMEKYIQYEYDSLFDDYLDEREEEDPAWIYQMEFLSSGKSQDEWSKEDDEKCKELTKAFQEKNFLYEKIKKNILKTVDHNRLIYQELVSEYFGENTQNIKIDKEIFPISLEELINENIIIKNTLDTFGFILDTERDLSGIQIFGKTRYYKNNDCKLRIILKHKLFLEFIIDYKDYTKRVNLYDGDYFWFGWLVGKSSVRNDNINEALNALESLLSCPHNPTVEESRT